MIETSTVLVLGAGASKPFGYPTGPELFYDVCELLNSEGQAFNSIGNAGFDKELIKNFRSKLYASGRNSVDEFLEHRPEFMEVGKYAIASALLQHEKPDNLYKHDIINNWYKYLFQKMNSSLDDFDKNKIAFITFNYDRSLEYFLYNSLRNSYKIEKKEAAVKIRNIKLLHLHGQLCKLPCYNNEALDYIGDVSYDYHYEDKMNGEVYRNYQCRSITTQYISYSAKGIKIIHDKENEKEFEEAIQIIKNAERVYFLGFGYHSINLERLKINEMVSHPKPLFAGTALGLTDLEKRNINNLTNQNISHLRLKDCDIVTFFREYYPLN